MPDQVENTVCEEEYPPNSQELGALFVIATVSAALACFELAGSMVHAATTVPTTLNFQGRLTDTTGSPVADGLYNMQFRLFTVDTGGSSVWDETRETTTRVQVTNGLFATKLGDVTPLSASLFASGALYLRLPCRLQRPQLWHGGVRVGRQR